MEKNHLFLEGKKILFEYRGPITTLVTTQNSPIPKHLSPQTLIYTTEEVIKKISGIPSPEPYLAEIPLPKEESLEGQQRLLALDGVQDPGNLGTLLRTALAFGFEGVFLLNATDPFSPKALRASKGAIFHLPFRQGSEKELLDLIKTNQLTPYVADTKGTSASFEAPLVLILGNEAHGPSETLKMEGTLVSVPMHSQTESLNVAVAGGILMNKIEETS